MGPESVSAKKYVRWERRSLYLYRLSSAAMSLSLSESVRIAADRVSTHKAVFLSQRTIVLKRKPLAVTLTGRSRLPILNIPFVPILCTCLCMACR